MSDMDVEATKKMTRPDVLYYVHTPMGNVISGAPSVDDEVLDTYVNVAALPDDIDIFRAIKKSGARKHGDIAKVISSLYTIKLKEPKI